MAKKGLKRVFFDDFGEKGQKRRKMSNFGQKWRFFDVFWKSSKKNFNFALIRPFFGGRAQALKMGVDFCPFWIETIWESVLRVPIRLLLSDAFFFGARGAPRGTPQIWHFCVFCVFYDFWPFLVFFGHFWPFFVFLALLAILVFFGHFGLFLGVFQRSL